MANEPIDQAINQLKTANNCLLVFASGGNLDDVAAGLALQKFLHKMGKSAQVVSGSPILSKFEFLPDTDNLLQPDALSKDMVISISLKNTELSELRYQKMDDTLSVFLTPKAGQFELGDISVRNAVYPYDLIVTLGVARLEDLGGLYSNHAQLFFETPVINIDFRADNDLFGQVNLVTLTASSVSEVVYDLVSKFDETLVDDSIATMLLAGLVAQTNSFQSQKTTPQAFVKASKLISLGARQQEIVTKLYRSKNIGMLRLWGRALARLKHNPQDAFAFTVVSASDIERSEALHADIDELISEMSQQLPFAKSFLILAETSPAETTAYVSSLTQFNPAESFAAYNPVLLGVQTCKFKVARPLAEAEPEILNAIQVQLQKFRA